MRTAQSDKRLRKVRSVVDTFESPLYEDAPLSAKRSADHWYGRHRAVSSAKLLRSREKGLRVNHVQIRLLSPFPVCALNHYLQEAKNRRRQHNATHSWHG